MTRPWPSSNPTKVPSGWTSSRKRAVGTTSPAPIAATITSMPARAADDAPVARRVPATRIGVPITATSSGPRGRTTTGARGADPSGAIAGS
jgi:hypothetical protein